MAPRSPGLSTAFDRPAHRPAPAPTVLGMFDQHRSPGAPSELDRATLDRRFDELTRELGRHRPPAAESIRIGTEPGLAPATHTRLRSRPVAPIEPREIPEPSAGREPGRHAARTRISLGGPVAGLTRGHLLLLVLLVSLVGGGSVWWWQRPPAPMPDTGPVPPSSQVTSMAAATTASPAQLVVDVAGKVRRPGIAVLTPGARVVDALRAAGGARAGVDLSGLNLARPLVDGEQILVGLPTRTVAPIGSPSVSSSGTTQGPLVNLNTADQVSLESLPEVGPVTAAAIVSWREQHGGFTAVEQLLEVDGIGEATLARLLPLVTL